METVIKCLCGAEPVVEQKSIATEFGVREVYKYKCPNCKEKELPYLGQWGDCGAMQEWNRIALERDYRRRTLEYNEHGICISTPYKVFEWKDKKKGWQHITVNIYLDNSVYYYCFDFYVNGGCGFMLGIMDECYPSLETAKKAALENIISRKESLKELATTLLVPEQGELFA